MFFSVEIFHSLKVEEGVRGFLVVFCVFHNHAFEEWCSPLSYFVSEAHINQQGTKHNQLELEWEQNANDDKHKDELNN